jgi:hypothetical protein
VLLVVLVLFSCSRLCIVSRYKRFLLSAFYYCLVGDTIKDMPNGNTLELVIRGGKKWNVSLFVDEELGQRFGIISVRHNLVSHISVI